MVEVCRLDLEDDEDLSRHTGTQKPNTSQIAAPTMVNCHSWGTSYFGPGLFLNFGAGAYTFLVWSILQLIDSGVFKGTKYALLREGAACRPLFNSLGRGDFTLRQSYTLSYHQCSSGIQIERIE